MPKSKFHISFKKHFVLFLSALYLLNPMQKQIAEGMHTFSHVMTHTDYSHHEEDHLLGLEHTHKHKIITFFSKIFSSEENTKNHDGVFFNYTMDKHFAQEYPAIHFKFKSIVEHIYYFTFHIPKTVKTVPSTPPETFFS
ncbi:hypothetical protein [Aequorivita sp. CIP111184]|uniref:hypothetical protein n=1 Tax=Aequorivita sp. CIP111184 TaxID=2211356 RepID=UPI000DBC3951|nr:hypothetical protein [Aequorivita sp. CIP111184]SRX52419.1 hypothetical protein AEQU1_00283 [Aequorivita sp. CIP111184]